ncbi:acyltransferase [Pseudomonas sp.]|uniref:acyltransferase n=1 Tax=Pseudomonas sp. TaxID=306 RepID=UPI00290C443E|nr:acyltransferase [Pseudomonas sp.]MDU4251698.1 acyltransferase [Pseudomonas sp.]
MAFYSAEEIATLGFKRLGKNVRISRLASIYNHDQIEIGDHSRIDDFCVISGKITIGRNVHVAVFCNLAGGEPGITMEDFSGLAYGCNVFTQSDDYSGRTLTNPTVPDQYKKETKAAIVIGRHSIVGTQSIIFPGVHLAEGTSVGAMTMMTRDSEPWSVYFGCPGRKLKERKRDLLEMEAVYLASPEA